MKTEIVIARYNEDLSWLKKIPKNIKITIYNKGKDDIENMKNLKNLKYNIIKLPNIGRESHTYLYHIINNYDKLADKTIFTQGESTYHSPGFFDLLKYVKLFEPVQPLTAYYCDSNYTQNKPKYPFPPTSILNYTKDLWIKGNPIHVEYMDNNYVTRYPLMYLEYHIDFIITSMKKLHGIDNLLKFDIERFRLKNVDPNYLIPTCYAAQFCINKNVILENSIDFYNNIMNILIYDIRNDYFFDTGFILEKLWLVIFDYKKYNKNYIPIKIEDIPIYDVDLKVKNNNIHFKLFQPVLQVYLELFIDNQIYKLAIIYKFILFKSKSKNKTLLKILLNENYHNKKIKKLFTTSNDLDIQIELKNNNFIVFLNNVKIINYHFKYNVNNINSAKIFTITDQYKLIDVLV
jgi:hypothetical protein